MLCGACCRSISRRWSTSARPRSSPTGSSGRSSSSARSPPCGGAGRRSAPLSPTAGSPLTLLLTAVLIGVNWLVYIYAVVSGHVLEGSLGYYLNPLVNVLLGVFLLKERLSLLQKAAVLLAGGRRRGARARRRRGDLDQPHPRRELRRLRLPAQGGAGRIRSRGCGSRRCSWRRSPSAGCSGSARPATAPSSTAGRTDLLLILGGAVTAIPLLLFTAAAKRLPYSTLGFLQYIAPVAAVPARRAGLRRAADHRPYRLLRRDLDGARHLRRRRLALRTAPPRRGRGSGLARSRGDRLRHVPMRNILALPKRGRAALALLLAASRRLHARPAGSARPAIRPATCWARRTGRRMSSSPRPPARYPI